MAITDNRLKDFFSKQKVGAFDSLLIKGKSTISPANTSETKNSNTERKELKNDELKNINSLVEKKSAPIKSKNYVDKPLAKQLQTVSKPLAKNIEMSFFDLMAFSKKERDLLEIIFEQCKNNGTLISPPISTEEIRKELDISAERVRNLIFRITKKGGVKILRYKNGMNAHRVFELPKSIYQFMIDKKISVEQKHPELATSIAINDNNENLLLTEEWSQIDIEPLSEIGFSRTHLNQLYRSNCTNPEIVQKSINHFAYGIENNAKFKSYSDPLNVLMGVLRKGQAWHEHNYISPKELALKQMVDEARIKKEKQELMIKELVELEFPSWRKKLTDLEFNTIVPEEVRKTNISGAIQSSLRAYFIEKIILPKLDE
ncbi:hypothetical protein [Legionella gresilensis]|uniref:hypothetical protein n=1 Tax=Legionella gresilensis TaxID=91823 RepID=UPI001041771B|nr:hypothetical protein [Legionella gresilensis]